MPKSSKQRQSAWRKRRDFRSAFYHILDYDRRARMRLPEDRRPEMQAIARFFLAYPRCNTMPYSLDTDQSGWLISLCEKATLFDAAAAVVALAEISSLPSVVILAGHITDVPAVVLEVVRKEVAEMRRLDLWDVRTIAEREQAPEDDGEAANERAA